MKIVIACDHSGLEFKQKVISFLESRSYQVLDAGVSSEESVDYPDVVVSAVKVFHEAKADKLILLCGTGIGVSIAANKLDGIFCALLRDTFSAEMAIRHNHANAIALGVRVEYNEPVEEILTAFFDNKPELGRHQKRVDKLHNL